MESNPLSNAMTNARSVVQRLAALARLAIGIAVLTALYYFGYLDLRVLAPLGRTPWTIAAAASLLLITLPIASWRWAIVLRALSVAVPLPPLFRIVCISTFVSQISFGPGSADAVRGIYAWRILRGATGRIAVSILVDRGLGLLALLALAATTTTLRWRRVGAVPELKLLAVSLLVCLAGGLVAGAILLAAPLALPMHSPRLQRHQRLARFLRQIRDVLLAFRKKLGALVGSACLSFIIHVLSIVSFLIVARGMPVGDVSLLDVAVAAPLAMVANILPFTPGGLGIGEAAFDQICRWLAPAAASAPYASLFFAFRAISLVVLIPGAVAFVMHRHDAERNKQ